MSSANAILIAVVHSGNLPAFVPKERGRNLINEPKPPPPVDAAHYLFINNFVGINAAISKPL